MESGARFREWLEERLRGMSPGQRLPTDRDLAGTWQLSPRTVRRVMAGFRARGALIRIPGKGTYTPGGKLEPSLPSADTLAASDIRLAHTLAQLIHRGELRRGDALPQVKYLCVQYHVSEKTVGAAYRRLVEQGLARKVGKRYWVGQLVPSARGTTTGEVWIAVGERADLPRIYADDFLSEAYRKMERELRGCGLTLRYAVRAELATLVRRWSEAGALPFGLVLCGFDGAQWPAVEPVLRGLVGKVGRPPVSVLMDLGDVGEIRTAPPRMNTISRGNLTTNQARAVAALADGIEIREVVLVMDARHVREHARHGFLRYYKTVYEVLEATQGSVKVRHCVLSGDGKMTPAWIGKHVFAENQWYVEYLLGKYGSVESSADAGLDRTPYVFASPAEIVTAFGSPALWVCPRMSVAHECFGVLRTGRVAVPDRVSLLSLEDDPRFLHENISAAAPDWDQVGYLMAHALLGDLSLERTHRGFVRLPVPLTTRVTTPKR